MSLFNTIHGKKVLVYREKRYQQLLTRTANIRLKNSYSKTAKINAFEIPNRGLHAFQAKMRHNFLVNLVNTKTSIVDSWSFLCSIRPLADTVTN